ncbi:MAG: glycosyltransferase [Thermaerobacter sp.]|nr:glycosyltransferase [Thermaerobacter sp.]
MGANADPSAVIRVDWRVARSAADADRVQADVLPDAIAAASGAGSRRVAVSSRLADVRRHGVAAVTRLPAGPLTFRGQGVVVPTQDLKRALQERGRGLAAQVVVLPFPAPEPLYDWDDTRAVVDVNERYHLEARPRVLAAADWERGQGLTRLLPLVRDVLHREGELVLLGALPHRERIAPLVAHLGLSEHVVLLPRVSPREAAGLLHGADVLVQAEDDGYPYWLGWAAAAGLPAVALDTPAAREASGHAALVVEATRVEAFPAAVTEALTNVNVRERQIARGRTASAPARLSHVANQWARFLEPAIG